MIPRGFIKVFANVRDAMLKMREKHRWETLQNRGMRIGKDVLFTQPVFIDTPFCYLISIGDRCRFGPNVSILAHDALGNEFLDAGRIAPVTIHESCSFGMGTIILPGVEIGPRVIVGAGSVISTNIPPDSVVAGNPAKVVMALKDYLRYHKLCLRRAPQFPFNQFGKGIPSPENITEIRSKIGTSFGYITGGYTETFGKKTEL